MTDRLYDKVNSPVVIEIEVPKHADVIEIEVPGLQGASNIDKPFDADPLLAYLNARGNIQHGNDNRNDSDH